MNTIKDIILTPECELSNEFVVLCKAVTAKRPRAVIDHILKYGIIYNEELSDLYGYNHPPRAIRDVRENGVPLLTHKVVSSKTGRHMAAYTFGDPANVKAGRIGGRKAFSKQFKATLLKVYGNRDAITGERLEERYLQIDHRIPYEVGGEESAQITENFMLLDASSQRAKSWSCERCVNFLELRASRNCQLCFWAFPEDYEHIAMEQKRRLDIVWTGEEISAFDNVKAAAKRNGITLGEFIKQILREK